MRHDAWGAIGRDARGLRGFVIENGKVAPEKRCAGESDLRAALGLSPDRVVRVGDGTPSQAPCAVLPDAGTCVPVITQDIPADILGAWVRIRIAGFLAAHDGWDGVICVQEGDVCHWVHVSADEIVSFQSFLTPRLIAALGGAEAADIEALADTQSRPERLAAHLRQAEISGNPAATTGHLFGAELAAARVYWLGQRVAVVTGSKTGAGYVGALEAQGVPVYACQSEDLLQKGLITLGNSLGLVG